MAGLAVPVSFALVFRNPKIQHFFSHFAAEWLSEYTGTRVTVGRITVSIKGTLVISAFEIQDHQGEELLSADKLEISIRSLHPRSRKIRVYSLTLHHPSLRIVRPANEQFTNLDQVIRRIWPSDTATVQKKSSNPWDIQVKFLQIHQGRFQFRDDHHIRSNTTGIDFNNISLKIHHIDLKDFRANADTIQATIRQVEAEEHSGFYIRSFRGIATFTPIFLECRQMLAEVNQSLINADIRMDYPDLTAFNDFISQVQFRGSFRPTVIDLSDIGYFAPEMFSMTNRVELKGDIAGSVNHFKAERLELTYGRNSSFVGNITIAGLPAIDSTFIQAEIRQLITDASDIRSFALPADNEKIKLPKMLQRAGIFTLSGSFTGKYNQFVARLNIRSALGNVQTQLQFRTPEPSSRPIYLGRIVAQRLNLGKLLNQEKILGSASFDLQVKGTGIDLATADLTAAGTIQSFMLYGYNYKNIRLDGHLVRKMFNGQIAVKDENIDLYFDGMADWNRPKPEFVLTTHIRHADLYRLQLTARDTIARLSLGLQVNFSGISADEIMGTIRLNHLVYEESNGSVKFDHLFIDSFQTLDSIRTITISSDLIDAVFTGNFQLAELAESFSQYLAGYSRVLTGIRHRPRKTLSPQTIQFSINIHHSEPLTRIFVPAISLAPQTSITGFYNSSTHTHRLEILSDSARLGPMILSNVYLQSFSDPRRIYLDLMVDRTFLIRPGEINPQGIGVDQLKFYTSFRLDTLQYVLSWDNFTLEQHPHPACIEGFIVITAGNRFLHYFDQFDVTLDDRLWTISTGNQTEYHHGVWSFKDIVFHSGNSSLRIGGTIAGKLADYFQLEFIEIDISNLDRLFGLSDFDLDGILNGKLILQGDLSKLNFMTDISIDHLRLNQQELGILLAETRWVAADQAMIVDLEMLKKGNIGLGKVVQINGYYYPERKDQNFDLNLQLSNLGLAFLNPFIKDIATLSRESLASGLLRLTGTIQQPVLEGFIQLMRTQVHIEYLNTLYSLSGKAVIEKNWIDLNGITINDIRGRSALCQGYISHNYFRDFFIDLQINHHNFKVLNTTARDNELFYGTGFTSGNFRMVGPFDDLSMEVNVRTESGTSVKIPISTGVSVMENDFIIFRQTDTVAIAAEPPAEVRMKGLEVSLTLNVNENAHIELFLPYAMGTIEGNGRGELGIHINKRGDFSIFGDYVITQGKFYFTFENFFSREFDIIQGSRISWQGDPYEGNIQLKATHLVKTTLEGLPIQVDSAYLMRERVDVMCIIYLENDLLNPDIRFSVDFLNVPSSTKEILYASLDTTDQSAMSQQILSLLLIGSFSYTTSTASLSSTSFRLLSNQLSNMLSRISKDFDIGIRYQPGTLLTEDELQVALRTQLFNNRLIIDGNFGVRGTSNTQNTSNMVGDVNLEYKITPDGRVRIRAFNRSNILNVFENYAPYTQGVGLSYRREFDSFSSIFSRKSRKSSKPVTADQRIHREAILESAIRFRD